MSYLGRLFLNLILIAFTALSLAACSTVGPGFKNHPADCAMGIPWADCLPGTAGYNNGGGEQHRNEAKQVQVQAKQQNDTIDNAFKAASEQCKKDLATPELDPIRHKVELFREINGAAPRSRSQQTTHSQLLPSVQSSQNGRPYAMNARIATI